MRLGLKGLSLSKPSVQAMEECADKGGRDGPNHLLVGASEVYVAGPQTRVTSYADGWIEDYDATKVGEGEKAYMTAREALKAWRHMSLGWVDTNKPPIRVGSRVCIAAKMLCFWQRNPLEIVYVTEGQSHSESRGTAKYAAMKNEGKTFGFGQTTLRGHALAGEERFTVRWKPDNSVWYEVYAFSKAKTILAVVGFPVRRFFQHKFRRDSAKSIVAAVQQT